jgi:pimeloyl-ACP methyl ester carboxylesterase
LPFVSNGGVRIYCEVVGNPDGKPVVLHSGGCGDRRIWSFAGYLERLADMKCILIDHRGRGLSDRPREMRAHSMENYVSDVVMVLDELGIGKSAFWGYSDGGRIGFALASRHPGRVSGLVSTGNWGQWMSEEYYADLASALRKKGMMGMVREIEREERLALPESVRTNLLETDPEMYALNEEAWSSERATLVRGGFRTPTLLFVGELEDKDRRSERLAREIPNCRLKVLPGLAHIGAFVRSDLAFPEALEFLRVLG